MLNPETITALDPACGSGHILVEAYDVLKAIYLERGYRMRDIPRLILEKNLYGLDIDERAAQLAGFALLMKARADDRRLLDNPPKLNVLALQESKGLDADELIQALAAFVGWADAGRPTLPPGSLGFANSAQPTHSVEAHHIRQLIDIFAHALTFGSLIQIPPDLNAQLAAMDAGLQLAIQSGDLLAQAAAFNLLPLVLQARILGMQFDAVVANPPYMGNKYLTPKLKSYLRKNYKGFEKDLFSAFMIRNLRLSKETGQLGFMSPFVWMFISSYENLRNHFICNATITSLIQPEIHAFFDSAFVSICCFTVSATHFNGYMSSFIRLTDFYGADLQLTKTLEAIKNPNCSWFYTAKPDDFKKIPGSPVVYWTSNQFFNTFLFDKPIGAVARFKAGMSTGDNPQFQRYWHEVDFLKISFDCKSSAGTAFAKWFPCNSGGEFRKWYGNNEIVVEWENNGEQIRNYNGSAIRNAETYFHSGLTYSKLSSGRFAARFKGVGFVYDDTGRSVFGDDEQDIYAILGLLCSEVAHQYLSVMAPTMSFTSTELARIPFLEFDQSVVSRNVYLLIDLAKADWDTYETSWEFIDNPLITPVGYASRTITSDQCQPEKVRDAYPTLEDSVAWGTDSVIQQTEATNVGLRDKAANPTYTPSNLEQCFNQWQTQNRAAIVEMQRLEEENNRLFIEAYGLQDELSPEVPEEQITLTRADRAKDCQRLISYAIGCMMGRYSLDEPGLICANAGNVGFDPNRYNTFPADADGIVPITDELWFEDDAANRIREFLLAVWNIETLDENMAWLAESLGQKGSETPIETIRRYLAGNFFKNHLQTYKKRPIYWLFSSGKQGAFQALVYLHRYHESTLARMRAEYVVPLTGKIQSRIEMLEKDAAVAASNTIRSKLNKDIEKLKKKHVELLAYDEKLRHYADQRIQLDLDEGVKVNYGKFGDLLAEVKPVTGGAND